MLLSWILKSYHALPVAEAEAPELYEILTRLSAKAGIPRPRLFVIPTASPNAMTVGLGRRHAGILVTQGLVEKLNREELEGVFAHELAHLRHQDLPFVCAAALLAACLMLFVTALRGIFMFSDYRRGDFKGNALVLLVSAVVIPPASIVLRLAASRAREFRADERACEWIESPLYLASALRKIETGLDRLPLRIRHPEWAPLFVVNPLKGKGWEALFKTHPRTEERILRLERRGDPWGRP